MHAASKEIFQKYIIRHINFPVVPPTRNDYCFIIRYILGQMFVKKKNFYLFTFVCAGSSLWYAGLAALCYVGS